MSKEEMGPEGQGPVDDSGPGEVGVVRGCERHLSREGM